MLPPHYVPLQPCASPTALAEFSNLAPVAPAAPGGSWACHFLLFVPRPNSALRPIAIASPGCRLLMRVHIWRLLGALLALVVESTVCTQFFPRRLAFLATRLPARISPRRAPVLHRRCLLRFLLHGTTEDILRQVRCHTLMRPRLQFLCSSVVLPTRCVPQGRPLSLTSSSGCSPFRHPPSRRPPSPPASRLTAHLKQSRG